MSIQLTDDDIGKRVRLRDGGIKTLCRNDNRYADTHPYFAGSASVNASGRSDLYGTGKNPDDVMEILNTKPLGGDLNLTDADIGKPVRLRDDRTVTLEKSPPEEFYRDTHPYCYRLGNTRLSVTAEGRFLKDNKTGHVFDVVEVLNAAASDMRVAAEADRVNLAKDGEPVFVPNPDEFIVRDSGKREQFGSGMVRDTTEGKVEWHRVSDGPMLRRWADHLTKGKEKYPDVRPGEPNWMLAAGVEEMQRFRQSAYRHFMQWFNHDCDEDHAAAVFFNINGFEYVKRKMAEGSHETAA